MDGGSLGDERPAVVSAERRAWLERFDLMTESDLATLCDVSVPTVQRWRSTGGGPTPTKLGDRTVAYRKADVDAWLLRQADRVPGAPGRKGGRK